MPEIHAKLSASISKRWMWDKIKGPNDYPLKGCPGSITLSSKVVEPPRSNIAADTGTAAHYMGEKCLLDGKTVDEFVSNHPKDYINVTGAQDNIIKIPITEQMIEGVRLYTNTIWSDIEHYEKQFGVEAQIFVEEEFSLNHIFSDEDFEEIAEFIAESDLYPEIDDLDAEEYAREWLTMFGTNDCSVVYPGKALFIYDYKNGRWPVPAENNTQFLYYAIGAAEEHNWDFEYIEMLAIQPNSMDEEKTPRWRITKEELLEWVPVFKECALNTIRHPDEFNTGEHCHFCPAKGMCQKQANDAMDAAKIDFEEDFIENDKGNYEVSLSPIDSLSYNDMRKILDNADAIMDFVKGVQTASKNMLLANNKEARNNLGKKLVHKAKNRKIHATDQEIIDFATNDLLLDINDITENLPEHGKLLTMSKLENVIGKEEMKQFISRPEPDIIMVSEDDSREEIVISAADDFDDDLDEL